ncbi:hypothetical protein Ciccas_013828, partial [Cichlidogyrus casuarinus]
VLPTLESAAERKAIHEHHPSSKQALCLLHLLRTASRTIMRNRKKNGAVQLRFHVHQYLFTGDATKFGESRSFLSQHVRPEVRKWLSKREEVMPGQIANSVYGRVHLKLGDRHTNNA